MPGYYPNPGNGEFTLEVGGMTGKVNMTVFNLSGVAVDEYSYTSEGNLRETFNLAEKGVYIVRITGQNTTLTRRVIVQ